MRNTIWTIGACLLAASTAWADPDVSTTLQSLQDQISAQNAKIAQQNEEIAQLRAQNGQSWLNERRAEEVKALVREILSDADTRASLMSTGMSAGYNGKFYLASEDGTFLMNIGAAIQLRYLADFRQRSTGAYGTYGYTMPGPGGIGAGGGPLANSHDDNHGFELSRTALWFTGFIADPKIMYEIRLAVDRGNNEVVADHANISYKVDDNWTVYGGRYQTAFQKEDSIDEWHQMAVDRSFVSNVFSLGVVEGVGVVALFDPIRVNFSFDNGGRSGQRLLPVVGSLQDLVPQLGHTYDNNLTNYSVTARVDAKLAGDWMQEQQFTAPSGDPQAAFVGAAIHYESFKPQADRSITAGTPPTTIDIISLGPANNLLMATVDGLYKNQGWSFFASGSGAFFHLDTAPPNSLSVSGGKTNLAVMGIVAQASYNINDQVEPFARYEWLYFHDYRAGGVALHDYMNMVTVGFNWYQHKQNAKFTADLVWAINQVEPITTLVADPTQGLLPDANGKGNQLLLRLQYQLLF